MLQVGCTQPPPFLQVSRRRASLPANQTVVFIFCQGTLDTRKESRGPFWEFNFAPLGESADLCFSPLINTVDTDNKCQISTSKLPIGNLHCATVAFCQRISGRGMCTNHSKSGSRSVKIIIQIPRPSATNVLVSDLEDLEWLVNE